MERAAAPEGPGDVPDPADDAADGRDARAAAHAADGDEEAEARAAMRVRLLEAAPEPVRTRVAELAAEAVGHLPMTDLPPPVRVVARFAPAKRARAGAGPLLAAVGSVEGFADQVVGWWCEERPQRWHP